jgi:imidazolonepropionase-like amidohydrolase
MGNDVTYIHAGWLIDVSGAAAQNNIKIVNSGLNSLIVFGRQTAPQFDSDELDATVKVAGQRGFKTMVHPNGKIPVQEALDAQCDSIEHGFFMGTMYMDQMAGSRTI